MAEYFPAFTIRESEVKGLGKLAGPTKDLIFPIVCLQAWPRKKNGFPSQVQRSIIQLQDAFGDRPAALDLALPRDDLESDVGLQGRAEMLALHDPENGFDAWVQFIASTTFVPVLQWSSDATATALQLYNLLALDRSIVLRFRRADAWNISHFNSLPQNAKTALAGEHVLAVIDCGQIRRNEDITLLGASAQQAILTINAALPDSEVQFVIIGSSFPAEFASIHPEYANLEIRERQLHGLLAPSPPILQAGIELHYGDYGGVYADQKPDAFRGRPRVDLACPTNWIYHRRTPEEGYAVAAQMIMNSPEWDDDLLCWGAQEIRRAASGNVQGLGSGTPWTAIRINTHLHQQANFSSGGNQPVEEEWVD